MESPILSTISSTIVKKVRFFLTDEQLELQKEKYYWCSGCGKRYRNKRCFTIDFKEPMFKKPIKRDSGLYCHINCTSRNAVRECIHKMIEHVEIYAILDSIIEEIESNFQK